MKSCKRPSALAPSRRSRGFSLFPSLFLPPSLMLLKRKKAGQLVAAKNFKNTASACQCKQTICSSACKRTKKNFPQDALRTPTMLCAAVTEMQCSIAKPSPRAKAMFSDACEPPSVWFPRNAKRPSMRFSRADENLSVVVTPLNGYVRYSPIADIASCSEHVRSRV